MINILEYNKVNEGLILEKLQSRNKQFYLQFSKPLASNEKIFGSALSAQESVRQILEEIRETGEVAVRKYSKIFDQFDGDGLAVDQKEIAESVKRLDPQVVEALKVSIENVANFQKRLLPTDVPVGKNGNASTGAFYHPIERVGIYVPGGTAPLCSSVIMNALPAIVAGVPEVVLFTPPGKGGKVDDGILAACHLIGIQKVYRVGGVMAIGMMAFGTENFKKVDKIAGPGNSFVALAKKEVFGRVDIDLFAGPSEILIIADEMAKPHFIAADMIAQSEHDPMASAILITNQRKMAELVNEELKRQIESLPRKSIAQESLKNFGMLIVAPSITEAIELSNLVAPEHLELCVDQPSLYLSRVKNTGAVFLGNYTPEAAGDYLSGPSHTLPTSGTGRFYSGVSSTTFMRRTSIIEYQEKDFREDAQLIGTIARLEQLEGHARSALIRLDSEKRCSEKPV